MSSGESGSDDRSLASRIAADLTAALEAGTWNAYDGPAGRELLAALGDRFSRRHVQTVASGTIAVELALRGVGVRAGDEVILAAYDFPGNFRAIEALGATPVLIDVDPAGWSLDVDSVAAAISPATRAVLASHLHGTGFDAPRLAAMANERGIALVEDACQVPGATIGGRTAGSWGAVSVLSFGGSKLLSAGRGGAVLTDDPQIDQRMRIANDRGNLAYPLSELQAIALLPQLERLDAMHRARRRGAERLWERAHRAGLVPNDHPAHADDPAWYKFPLQFPDEATRDAVRARFEQAGIACGEGFRGFWRRTSRRCRAVGSLDVARRRSVGSLLIDHRELADQRIERVAAAIDAGRG